MIASGLATPATVRTDGAAAEPIADQRELHPTLIPIQFCRPLTAVSTPTHHANTPLGALRPGAPGELRQGETPLAANVGNLSFQPR